MIALKSPAQYTSTATGLSIAAAPASGGVNYTMTTSEIVIHRIENNFAFGELNTFVRLDDDAGGAFIVLRQPDSSISGEIRLDPEEIALIAQAAKTLLDQHAPSPESADTVTPHG